MKKSSFLSHICVFALGGVIAYFASGLYGTSETSHLGEKYRMGSSGGISRGGEGRMSENAHGDSGRRLGSRTSSLSPLESLGRINRITDASDRQRALMDFYRTLSPEQFAAVAGEFQELYHYDNAGSEMELLFRAWAKADPTGALGYIESNPDMRRNRSEVLETWALGDPAAAERWALANYEGDGANPYLAAVIKGIAPNDLPGALRLTKMMPLSRERGRAIDSIAKALLMSGNEAAFAFTDTIEDEHLKGSFVMMISRNLSTKDPQAAADWVASMSNGAVQARAAESVAGRLSRLDTAGTTAFISALRPEAQSGAAAAAIPQLSQRDIAGTARWVSTLAGTPGYDRVVESFIWSCDERAPEQSAAWIQGVSDPNRQKQLYQKMLGNWAKRDLQAAHNWISQNNVPDYVKGWLSRK